MNAIFVFTTPNNPPIQSFSEKKFFTIFGVQMLNSAKKDVTDIKIVNNK